MKITVFEVEPWERNAFKRLKEDHDVTFVNENLTSENVTKYSDADILSVFIYSKLDKEVLGKFENLQLITTRSTGFDHIDLDYCSSKDIAVCNVPSYGKNTVAEHVFGLLLTISHHLCQAVDRTRKGDFSLQGLRGFDLRGKTMGVVGTGDIGVCVIKIAEGFGMDILAYDVKPEHDLEDKYKFKYAEMDELLAESDIITLHVPANDKTKGMISSEQFDKMKKGVVIINTSRGDIIDVKPLLEALSGGKVAAAGLDVLTEEPVIREEAEMLRTIFHRKHDLENLLADHVLLRLRNVIITPHSAFYTKEAVQRILDTTVENIDSYIYDDPQNIVEKRA